jgi:hypothetical protein
LRPPAPSQQRVLRLFSEAFTAKDIAEPLRSFDADADAQQELESLRHDLAHGQDIVSHDWAQIARMARRVEANILQLTEAV